MGFAVRTPDEVCMIEYSALAACNCPGKRDSTYQGQKSEAADGAPSKRQVVAVVPGSQRADRDGNRRIEQPIRSGASAGAA